MASDDTSDVFHHDLNSFIGVVSGLAEHDALTLFTIVVFLFCHLVCFYDVLLHKMALSC